MKKTFLAKRNAWLSPSGVSWGAGALLFVLALLLVRILFPGFVLEITAPVFGVGDWIAGEVQNLSSGFDSNAGLARANAELLAQNEALSLENRTLVEQGADTAKLMAPMNSAHDVIAGVILRPPESPYDTLVIGAGSAEGIAQGREVFGPGGVPLGTISSVSTDDSRVTLFSATGVQTPAWVGSTRIPLNLIGSGGGTFVATVPRTAPIAVGDLVLVGAPGAIPIGSVTRIDTDSSSPTLSLRIVPAINLFSLTWMRVGSIVP